MSSQRRLLVRSCAVNLSRRLTIGIFIVALAWIATPAHAINKTWVANGSGNWNTSGAWSPSGVPDGGEFDVIIDDGSHSVVVTQNGDITINSLTLGSNDTLVIEGTFSSTSLTSDEGFTNNGTIRLTGFSSPSPRLSITSGALTNSATGVLHFDPSGSGGQFFAGDLVNNGTVTVDHNATFDKLNGTYTNNAQFSVLLNRTLTINADGTLNQNGGTFVLDGTVSAGIGEFTVSGGMLNVGANGRVIDGDFNYLGGTISNPLTLQNTTLTIGPAATNAATFHMTGNNTLASNINAGQTITVQSGFDSVTLTSAGGFTNNGTIRLSSEKVPSPFLTVEDGTLTNSATGLLDFDAGGGDAIFTSELLNNGTVTVDQDSIFNKLDATYTNNGQFSIADDKTLTVINGGILEHEASTFTLDGELDISGSTFNMNGGTLNFGGTALIDNGNFNYVDGTVNGTVKLRNTTFTIGPGADATTFFLIDDNTLASDVGAGHTINVQSTNVGAVTLTSNSSFTNAGTLDVQSTGGTSPFLYLPTEANDTVTNTGTLRFQSSSSAAPVFTGSLVNSGIVEVDNDTIFNKLNATYTNNGQFSVDSGATLNVINGGTLDQDGGTLSVDGELEMSGTFNMNGGVMNFAAAALIDNGNFNYLGGTINGDVKLRNTTFTIGTGTNPETFQLNHDNTLAGNVGAGHTINVEAANNAITLQSNTSFTNAGTINVKSSDASTFLYLPTEANDTVTNTGTLRFQSSGSGDPIFTGSLVNSGIVEVENDTLFNKLNASYTNNGILKIENGQELGVINAGSFTNQSGSTLTGGTFDINGTLRYVGANVQTNQAEIILRGTGSTIRNADNSSDALAILATNGAAGKLRLLEGRDFSTLWASFTNQGVLELSGTTFAFLPLFGTTFNNTSTGQITGEGTIQGNSGVHVSNAGLVAPGTGTAAGILNFNGPYTQASTGSLAISIFGNDNSDPQNLEFDVLSVGGPATLNGSLSVALGNFTPDGDDQFTILDAGSLSGQFSNALNGQRLGTLDGAGSFLVNYNVGGGNVTLTDFRLTSDFNFDGVVDAADYVMWRKVINTPASYAAWRTSFGESTLSGFGGGQGDNDRGAVPEPSAIALAGIALLLGALRRHR